MTIIIKRKENLQNVAFIYICFLQKYKKQFINKIMDFINERIIQNSTFNQSWAYKFFVVQQNILIIIKVLLLAKNGAAI